MTLYELNKILKNKGYKLIRHYPEKEIWEKDGKSLTIPTNSDTLHRSIAKDLLNSIK